MKSARILSVGALAGATVACAAAGPATTPARYVVTAAPIDIGIRLARFCVAVDPADAQGVWWWEPGASGCSSRSTGPTVFHAEAASVSNSGSGGTIDVRFRVPLIQGPNSADPDHKDVRLVLEGARVRVPATGADVSTVRRSDLELPERVR
jgi:hypothetical protein